MLEAINLKRHSDHVSTVLALKFLHMTVLKTVALHTSNEKCISKKDNLLFILGSIPGMQRSRKIVQLGHQACLSMEMNAW